MWGKVVGLVKEKEFWNHILQMPWFKKALVLSGKELVHRKEQEPLSAVAGRRCSVELAWALSKTSAAASVQHVFFLYGLFSAASCQRFRSTVIIYEDSQPAMTDALPRKTISLKCLGLC